MTTVAITQQIAVAAVHTSAFKRYIVTNWVTASDSADNTICAYPNQQLLL
jgi:hypothetical protein